MPFTPPDTWKVSKQPIELDYGNWKNVTGRHEDRSIWENGIYRLFVMPMKPFDLYASPYAPPYNYEADVSKREGVNCYSSVHNICNRCTRQEATRRAVHYMIKNQEVIK